jgi:hypothetical protein
MCPEEEGLIYFFHENRNMEQDLTENTGIVGTFRLAFGSSSVRISAKTFVLCFQSPARQLPGYYLDYTITASFRILSNSVFILPLDTV